MFKKEQGKQIVEEHIGSQNILKRYIKGNLLGKGGFAKCYEFISEQTNRKYAAKIIQKSSLNKSKAKQKLQSEIKIHKSLHHHQIVNFEHFFEDEEYVYILLEICRPETLNDLLKRRKRITQFEIRYYIYQITDALKYIHGKKVIHRDLKLGNLFLTDELRIKVGDFGLATKLTFDNERRKTTCGTPNYLAPEILINKNGHSYEVDIWSIGVITYALLFGRPPFQTNDLKLTYNKIKTCNYAFPDTVNVSPAAKRFITKILQLQPHKRPSLAQILEDQFMTSTQIPKSLPLATISIPPSANFIKKYQKTSQVTANAENNVFKNFVQQSSNTNSYRTLDRNKIMMSTDKLQTSEKKDNLLLKRDTSKQNLIMQRAASTAGLLQSKKNSSSFRQAITSSKETPKQMIPLRVIYFQQNPKFGISYMLSTNAFGMRYNDSTCLITNSQLTELKYLIMEPNLKQVSSQVYLCEQAPQSLAKKIKINSHYVKELRRKKVQAEQKMSNQLRIQLERMRAKENGSNVMKVYVARSLKTSKAQFFQFNNQFVQVIFEDSSQLVFRNPNAQTNNSNQNAVNYINKFSQLKQFVFSKLQQQSQDIKKRMNYALNVIGRVKKSLENKQVSSKQNKITIPIPFQSVNQSLQKPRSGLGRSSSTVKVGMQAPQFSLSKQNSKHFNSTAKLTTITNLTKASGSYALREISNRYF